MSKDDWEFLFELMLAKPTQPQECGQLIAMLQTFPHDRGQRGVVADWFYEHGYDRCSKLIRKGYTPGGPCGPDLDKPIHSPGSGFIGEPLFSGLIASGVIGTYQLSSGSVWNPPPGMFASGSITLDETRRQQFRTGTTPSGSAYEELGD